MFEFFTKFMMFVHMFVGLILIAIILLQRGRGGGLAGAFGGMGGQSAFGTKAGDVFTKITIYIASVWIVLGCVCVIMASNFKATNPRLFKGGGAAGVVVAPDNKDKNEDDQTGEKKPAGDEKAGDGVSPAPENPPAGKTEEKPETKPEGDAPKAEDKAEPKPADADAPSAVPEKKSDPTPPVKEGAAPEAKESSEKPKESTDKKPE